MGLCPSASRFQSSTRLTAFATQVPSSEEDVVEVFQSSTRLTAFATAKRVLGQGVVPRFQSSTRLTAFATPGWGFWSC